VLLFSVDDVFGCLVEYNVQHLFAGYQCFCILIRGARLVWRSLAVFCPSGTEGKLDSSESTIVTYICRTMCYAFLSAAYMRLYSSSHGNHFHNVTVSAASVHAAEGRYRSLSEGALCNVISEGYIAVHLGALLLAGLLT